MKNKKQIYLLGGIMVFVAFLGNVLAFLWVGNFNPDKPFSLDGFITIDNLIVAIGVALIITVISWIFISNKDDN